MTEDYFKFGYDYFDNRETQIGYGGYNYDGRYAGTARAMCDHYGIRPSNRVLEVGGAKGFLLVEFYKLGLETVGLDISEYAIQHAHSEIRQSMLLGDLSQIPFKDHSFDLVIAKDVLPHISVDRINSAIRECMRVSKGPIFFEIQCGETPVELQYLRRWDGTHVTTRSPAWWDALLESLGYKGDVHYKVLIPEDVR